MNKTTAIIVLVIVILLVLFFPQIKVQDSEATGCIRYVSGILTPFFTNSFGGCRANTYVLTDLTVEPASSCLQVMTNTCTNPMLEIFNRCDVPFVIQNFTIKPMSSGHFYLIHCYLGNYIMPRGEYYGTLCASSFEPFSVKGSLGNTEVNISFTQKYLC